MTVRMIDVIERLKDGLRPIDTEGLHRILKAEDILLTGRVTSKTDVPSEALY